MAGMASVVLPAGVVYDVPQKAGRAGPTSRYSSPATRLSAHRASAPAPA